MRRPLNGSDLYTRYVIERAEKKNQSGPVDGPRNLRFRTVAATGLFLDNACCLRTAPGKRRFRAVLVGGAECTRMARHLSRKGPERNIRPDSIRIKTRKSIFMRKIETNEFRKTLDENPDRRSDKFFFLNVELKKDICILEMRMNGTPVLI